MEEKVLLTIITCKKERENDVVIYSELSNKNGLKLNFLPHVECTTHIPFFKSVMKVELLTTVTLIRFAYVYS